MSQLREYPKDKNEREKCDNLYGVFVALAAASNAATMIFQKHLTDKQKYEGFLFGVKALENNRKSYVYIVAPIHDRFVGTHMIAVCSSESELREECDKPDAMFHATICKGVPGSSINFDFPRVGAFLNDPLFNAQQAVINAIIVSGKFNS